MASTKVLFFIVLIFASSYGYELFSEFEDNNTTTTTGDLTTGVSTTGSTTGETTTGGATTGNTTGN